VGAEKHNFKIVSYSYDMEIMEILLRSPDLWIILQLSSENLQLISNTSNKMLLSIRATQAEVQIFYGGWMDYEELLPNVGCVYCMPPSDVLIMNTDTVSSKSVHCLSFTPNRHGTHCMLNQ
jgi:hypothetical protein